MSTVQTSQYYGLSLSERLSKAGFSNAFSAAVKATNDEKIRQLLNAVEYSNDTVNAMAKTFLNTSEAEKI